MAVSHLLTIGTIIESGVEEESDVKVTITIMTGVCKLNMTVIFTIYNCLIYSAVHAT